MRVTQVVDGVSLSARAQSPDPLDASAINYEVTKK